MKRFLLRTMAALMVAALFCAPFAGEAGASGKRAIGLMQEGDSVDFGPSFRGVPASSILWSSTDASVGAIEEGRLEAISPGRTVISAQRGGRVVRCGVVVLPLELTVPLGETASLPSSGRERYYVEDKSIAAVSKSGQVLGLAEGDTRLGVACGGQRKIVQLHVTDGGSVNLLQGNLLKGLRIGIDPGHQGRANAEREPVSPVSSDTKAKVSSGTAGARTGIPEHETNLSVAIKLRDALQALGAQVYMTRESADVDISNLERARLMSTLNVDLALRLHCNGNSNPSDSGMDVYARKTCAYAAKDPARAERLLANEKRAAEAVFEELATATGGKRNGIHYTDKYTMNNWSTVPCLLVEMGYLTNPEEDALLNDAGYQDRIVQGLVNGICAYAGRERAYA